jgi:Histidine kinase-like ATPase domain
MCRRAVIGLAPSAQAPRDARSFIARSCERWELTSVADEAALAVSELVTNAVLHARTHLEVTLSVASGTVEIAVRDHEPRPPVLRPMRTNLLADLDALAAQTRTGRHGPTDERHESLHVGRSGSVAAGRGLLIVNALADEWGVTERVDGKEVWLTMANPTWSHLDACDCAGTSERSASGLACHHIPGPWDDRD